jgi:anti-sigma B factor antagonist
LRLRVGVSEQGTTTTISLVGEWDLAQQPAMRRTIVNVLARLPECVVLDLSGLDFIDSAGIHGVLELHRRSEQQQARLVIVPGGPQVQRSFELVGLAEILPFLREGWSRGQAAASPCLPKTPAVRSFPS